MLLLESNRTVTKSNHIFAKITSAFYSGAFNNLKLPKKKLKKQSIPFRQVKVSNTMKKSVQYRHAWIVICLRNFSSLYWTAYGIQQLHLITILLKK